MFKYHKNDPSIQPSNFTFNIILKVLSRSIDHNPDAAIMADKLLTEMDAMPSVTPDFISYVTCVIAWGRSKAENKIKRVSTLLHRFVVSLEEHQDGNKKSSVVVFNAVLSVCHHNLSPELLAECFETAQVAMTELRKAKGIDHDQITYSSFFQVVKDGITIGGRPARSFFNLIEDEFRFCINDGYVTRDILMAFCQVVPKIIFAKYVGQHEDPETFSIPKAWSRNVAR